MLRGARLALQDALTAQIGGAMAQAAKAAAPQGKKAAAAAATDAYEDSLDLAVALGWAFVDRVSYEVALPSYVAYALPFVCLRSQALRRENVNSASCQEDRATDNGPPQGFHFRRGALSGALHVLLDDNAGLCRGGAERPSQCQASPHAPGHALWPDKGGAPPGILPGCRYVAPQSK